MLSGLLVVISDAPQCLRIVLCGMGCVENDGLIADDAGHSVDRSSVPPAETDVGFGANPEVRALSRETVESVEVKVRPIHHVEGACLYRGRAVR